MAEVLLFHHAQGMTSGVREFAEVLRQAGHTVHVPDLFEGRVFDDLDDGSSVISPQPVVAVGKGAVDQPDPLPLPRRQALQPQPLLSDLQAPV